VPTGEKAFKTIGCGFAWVLVIYYGQKNGTI